MEVAKVNRLDAHDRLEALQEQSLNISECCQNLIDQRPFGEIPFYIFAHARTLDDGFNKTIIWQPRLTKPLAQSNSMLFKAYPGKDLVKVIWMIPAEEMWKQYRRGNLTESQIIVESIDNFLYRRKQMEEKEADDLNDEEIEKVYEEISKEANYKKKNAKIVPFQKV